MNEETRANIIQGVSIAQKHLQHAWSSKPNGDFVILPGNTERHIESILDLVLHAVNEDNLTTVKIDDIDSRKHIESLYEKALDGIRNYVQGQDYEIDKRLYN